MKSEAHWKANERVSHVFRIDADGTNLVQLTNGDFKVNAELDWLERYALGREYVWERAPLNDEAARRGKPTESQ